jgi:hypothetical protein
MNAQSAIRLSNFIVPAQYLLGKNKEDYTLKIYTPLDQILWELVSNNPSWEVRAICNGEASNGIIDIIGFNVFKDGEGIGKINREYGREGYKFRIYSRAIEKSRERGSAAITSNAKKALSLIRTTFIVKTIDEQLREARESLDAAIGKHSRNIYTTDRDVKEKLKPLVHTFAMSYMVDEFAKFLETRNCEGLLTQLKESTAQMKVVDDIKQKFNAQTEQLVLVHQGKYVVKTGDNVQLYDDNTLPPTMRGKLGILKLVEPETVVENVGVRAKVDAFMLLSGDRELA